MRAQSYMLGLLVMHLHTLRYMALCIYENCEKLFLPVLILWAIGFKGKSELVQSCSSVS